MVNQQIINDIEDLIRRVLSPMPYLGLAKVSQNQKRDGIIISFPYTLSTFKNVVITYVTKGIIGTYPVKYKIRNECIYISKEQIELFWGALRMQNIVKRKEDEP